MHVTRCVSVERKHSYSGASQHEPALLCAALIETASPPHFESDKKAITNEQWRIRKIRCADKRFVYTLDVKGIVFSKADVDSF